MKHARLLTAACAGSVLPDAAAAAEACRDALRAQGLTRADWLLVQANAALDLGAIADVLRAAWPGARLHVASSCHGSMCRDGLAMAAEAGLAVLGLSDPQGDFGAASGRLGPDVRATARALTLAALRDADRAGEAAELVWISSPPGREEAFLLGVRDAVGPGVPVIGGSIADNDISGRWRVLSPEGPVGDGAAVSVLFPSTPMGAAFHGGHAPTRRQGRVTAVEGRRLLAIDGEPAADVYARWTDGAVRRPETGAVNILVASSLRPLGRVARTIGGASMHLLSHPETICADGSLTLFTDLSVGDEITLMSGTEATLIDRAGDVVRSACRTSGIAADNVSAMILVYCAGCMLTVEGRMEEVRRAVADAAPGAPFIAAFTFGEQGPLLSSDNRHGNLMISAVVFGR